MQIKRLTVGKGRTTKPNGGTEEWIKEYYEIEALIEQPAELELAKANLTSLEDCWLSQSRPSKASPPPQSQEPTWDQAKIKWVEAHGSSGPYERSEDMNSPDFKALVKDLASHKGRLSKDGVFYWLFESGAVVGRKKRKQQP
jgi:hypothetical protein